MHVFAQLYDTLPVPVAVCRDAAALPVAYMNRAAKMLFAPQQAPEADRLRSLADLCRFTGGETYRVMEASLREAGTVGNFDAVALSFEGEPTPLRIQGNATRVDGHGYFVFYLADAPEHGGGGPDADFVSRLLSVSHLAQDMNQALQAVLELAGERIRASRAYIFEDISPAVMRNTFEWCAPGIPPVKEQLQHLLKADYSHDAIMEGAGMLITPDVSALPDPDRQVLEAQGVRAVAILPMRHRDAAFGYIGFDQCDAPRVWSRADIHVLKCVAEVAGSLIARRNAERQSALNEAVFRTVADNLDELVYISDIETHALKFVSRSLARAMKHSAEDILGLPCWAVLHRGQDGPCPFCPVPHIRDNEPGSPSYIWELRNSVSGKWYMVKDAIVDWIDGGRAHLGTLVDITYRKQYEVQLKQFASKDAMTDVYNRKWGFPKLEKAFKADPAVRAAQTICFFDVDGLKTVNDRLGHAAGDEMLVNIVQTIFSCIRKDDFIVRWGGDEFVVFLNCRLEDATGVTNKIQFGLEHFNRTQGKEYTLSASVGMVDFAEPYDTLDDLIAEADRRMYQNKVQRRLIRQEGGPL